VTLLGVGNLTFAFGAGFTISQYDDWMYYRHHFVRIRNGIKAMDILAVSSDAVAYLIEVKDYRAHQRVKATEIGDEICGKVLDTLAAMLPARLSSSEPAERAMAKSVAGASKIRVVLHLEQPSKHSKLFPRAIDPADVEQRLRQLLKPIDAHPRVTEMKQMRKLPWTVTEGAARC